MFIRGQAYSLVKWILSVLVLLILTSDLSAECNDPLQSRPGVPDCREVPGTRYTSDNAQIWITGAFNALANGNFQRAAQLFDEADVAVDQMLRECTPQSHCRDFRLTTLCNLAQQLRNAKNGLSGNIYRSYDNTLVNIQSWFSTPLCLDIKNSKAIGVWNWFNGIKVNIRKDGTFDAKDSIGNSAGRGTWTTNPVTRLIRLIWGVGYVDELEISADGMYLNGTNQYGTRVSATRTGSVTPPDGPRCTLDTSMMSGGSNLCTSFVEYHNQEKTRRTVHIVNDSHFQRGFNVPSNWYRGRYNECKLLSNEECR